MSKEFEQHFKTHYATQLMHTVLMAIHPTQASLLHDALVGTWNAAVQSQYNADTMSAEVPTSDKKRISELESILRTQGEAAIKFLAEKQHRISELEAELAHWKNNHSNEVARARVLKDRTDMPFERVLAYDAYRCVQEHRDFLNWRCAILLGALEKYGQHAEDCLADVGEDPVPCACGLSEILNQPVLHPRKAKEQTQSQPKCCLDVLDKLGEGNAKSI